jgi:hypothetical protein
MLMQVTLALYRKVADVFAVAYRARADQLPADEELPEMAAQLQVDLDAAPGLALLRDYWERAGAVREGVLFPNGGTSFDQGLRELVTLACAAQAYQRVLGKVTQTDKTTDTSKSEDKAEYKASTALKDVMNPLFGLAAGGAVGAGALASSWGALPAAALGVLTAGLTAATLQYNATRSRESALSREVVFLPNTSVESLDRMLPLLVERVRGCGITPIFVVDELDKISDLPDRIEQLVHHLKHFVTERAFFCFLTDRDFYEKMHGKSTNEPYPREHTYFSDRLLVYFAPDDLHEYLQRALQPDTKEDGQAAEVLRYILLHRARCHPFDLRQELGAFQNETDRIKLTTTELLDTRSYLFDVAMQVAVELMLRNKLITDRLASNPEFTQLACDALYYPSRSWEEGKAEIDLREGFLDYLKTRLGISELTGPEPSSLLAAVRGLIELLCDLKTLRESAAQSSAFPGSVMDVLESLARDPGALVSKQGERYLWRFDLFGRALGVGQPAAATPASAPAAAGATPAAPSPAPAAAPALTVDAILPGQLPEAVSMTGDAALAVESISPSGKEATELLAASERAIGEIEKRAAFVRAVSDDFINLKLLAVEYRVLSITPTWDGVQEAIDRVRRAGRNSTYAELRQDAKLLDDYSRLLKSRWLGVQHALYLSAFLGALGQLSDVWENWKAALHLMGDMLRFDSTPGEDIDRSLGSLYKTARAEEAEATNTALIHDIDGVTLKEALESLRANAPAIRHALGDRANQQFWVAWRKRFADALAGTGVFAAQWWDLVCAVMGFPWARRLNLDLAQVSVRGWTELLFDSLDTLIPPWVAAPALAYLGFRDRLANVDGVVPDAAREFRSWASRSSIGATPALVIDALPQGIGGEAAPLPAFPCLLISRFFFDRIYKHSEWIREQLHIRHAITEIVRGDVENDRDRAAILAKGTLAPFTALPFDNVLVGTRSVLEELRATEKAMKFPVLVPSPYTLQGVLELVQKVRADERSEKRRPERARPKK